MKNLLKEKFPICYKIARFLKKRYQYFILDLKVCKRFLSDFKSKLIIFNYKKPRELQLPITYKCNFDCVMCGMRSLIHKEDFTSNELDQILKNKLFQKIESVGVNGGEPFLKKNLEEYIEVIVRNLPKLKNIYIITNGYFTKIILTKLPIIKKICNDRGVCLNISISVDGIGTLQDRHRGNINASKTTFSTIDQILENRKIYCDHINIITTITKENIYNINEVEVWAQERKIEVSYNIATIHKRINNEYKYDDFSIFTDEHAKLLTQEFFYSKFLETKSQKYFGIYLYIKDGKRYSPCVYQKNGVTLTPNSEILYCATFSDELGNSLQKDPSELYFKNNKYRKQLKCERCFSCSHYIYTLSGKGYRKYCKELKK